MGAWSVGSTEPCFSGRSPAQGLIVAAGPWPPHLLWFPFMGGPALGLLVLSRLRASVPLHSGQLLGPVCSWTRGWMKVTPVRRVQTAWVPPVPQSALRRGLGAALAQKGNDPGGLHEHRPGSVRPQGRLVGGPGGFEEQRRAHACPLTPLLPLPRPRGLAQAKSVAAGFARSRVSGTGGAVDHALACAGPPPPAEQTRGTQNPDLGGRRREGSQEPRHRPPSALSALGAVLQTQETDAAGRCGSEVIPLDAVQWLQGERKHRRALAASRPGRARPAPPLPTPLLRGAPLPPPLSGGLAHPRLGELVSLTATGTHMHPQQGSEPSRPARTPPPPGLRTAVASPWLKPGSLGICLALCPELGLRLLCTDLASRGRSPAVHTEGTGALTLGCEHLLRRTGPSPRHGRGSVGQPTPHPGSCLLLESGLQPHPRARHGERPSGPFSGLGLAGSGGAHTSR